MTTTTNVKQTKLNIMTQALYNSITPIATEFYMVTDAKISYNDLTDKPATPAVPPIATSVSASSTNAETVGAKLFYDTVGNIETLLQGV